jgi:hypothetical protein
MVQLLSHFVVMSCTFRRKDGPKLWPQLSLYFQERERGFEPPTSSLGSYPLPLSYSR